MTSFSPQQLYTFLIILLLLFSNNDNNISCQQDQHEQVIRIYGTQPHPLRKELNSLIQQCIDNSNINTDNYCDSNGVFKLSTRISNDYASLLLFETAQDLFINVINLVSNARNSTSLNIITKRIKHILGVLSFAQGNSNEANKYWDSFQELELFSKRSYAAQVIMGGSISKYDPSGVELLSQYSISLGDAFVNIVSSNKSVLSKNTTRVKKYISTSPRKKKFINITSSSHFVKSSSTEKSEEFILSLLLNEAQGSVKTVIPSYDLFLVTSEIRELDAKQRFRLGVGLAKLGLFDMSLKHVWLAATPWEAPLYRLRAKLVFSPVHDSVRSLAAAVDNFERQGEMILLNSIPKSSMMKPICNSLNEAALALQSLPLLHLAGFASPRFESVLGHSAAALPILLGEVFLSMCPAQPVSSHLIKSLQKYQIKTKPSESTRKSSQVKVFNVGIVSGSFDGLPGKVIIGLLESISKEDRKHCRFVAMCFPTPRDATTDRVMPLFDDHVNLSPYNKTQSIERILSSNMDYILFADAGLDSRVFALAHERLALWQGLMWSWGGTLGIPTIDHYFIPEMLWRHSLCPTISKGQVPPQELFVEQVVLLEDLPYLPRSPSLSFEEVKQILQTRYLLPIGISSRIYLFPQSVKHIHPEFDQVIDTLLKADPLAIIILAVVKSGRDQLPTTHIAVRHDLMHPVMPVAAVAKLRNRLRPLLGSNIARFRILPPLDEQLLRGLMRLSVAVLDSYPVGMHIQILEAMLDFVPVISSFSLQECTNSHAFNFAHYLNISSVETNVIDEDDNGDNFDNFQLYPTNPEEFGVLAVRLSREKQLRSAFIANETLVERLIYRSKETQHSHGSQIVKFFRNLKNSYT